jgi:amino acid adenylation domain-containing protein
VHKAGGAYAPLDPNYPKQRVLLMLETARAKVLVTRRHLAAALGDELPAGLRTVFLDPGWETEPVEEPGAGMLAVLPDNLAYVIFTSGSTGVPKGVAIQHRSAVAMIRWARTVYSPEEYAGVLVSTSICFDMSVFEIFATLAEGGKLLLAENALALPDLEAKDEVVLVDTVPSAMAELLRLGRLPSGIRTVNLGGEPLKGSLVREIHEKLPGVERVINLYGPSEDTTFSAWSVVPPNVRHPLIGRPLTGESAYVLDGEMWPVPLGIPGALYLGGEGVTRGYLNRPELTAERYVPNPYGPPGSRLYQVGDLVRYRPTGELDFLGRLDHQVKVRGFRIELGEIESALTRHPEVLEAAVLAIPEESGGNRLVAYVETGNDAAFTGELRSFLKRGLPDYMVPSLFVLLREMPRTPNGKIDRRTLAAVPPQPERATGAGRSPRNYVEEVLVGIWSEVFDQAVRVEDNFFDLGGHSLLAIRVVSRIRSVLNVELPLQQMFAAPTVEGLAWLIEQEMEQRRGVPLPPIGRAFRERELPLSFAQQRLWFLDRLEPGTATFNLPAPLRLTGRLDVAALARALDEIVRRHESLRTRFGEREGRGYQEVQPPAPVPLPRIDLSGLPVSAREAEARKWADLEARLPFDLVQGPLLRTTLIQLDSKDGLLLVTLHHIATDGWSTEIFARELRALHAAFAAGLPSPLPEPPLQYPDFAVWQRGALDGETLKALLADWKQRFGTEVPPLRLPTDRPRPAVQTYPGAIRSLRFSEDLTRDVHKLARRSGATLFMTLVGAFQALLHRYSGQERIVVGSPVAGRSRPELEGMIGFFVNTLVLPADLSRELTFHQVLERSREMALGAYAYQDLPFEKLVEALQPVRDNSRSPLFQAMFLLQQHVREAPGSEGDQETLRVEPFGAGTGTSQFDLTLFAAEEAAGMLVGVEYNTDLFDAATMDRMLEHYRSLLAGAVANPEVRLADLPVPPLTATPQIVADAGVAAAKPEGAADARRDRLSSRLSKLSPAQREALERRLKGRPETSGPPAPSARCLVEIVPAAPGISGAGRRPFFCIHPAGGDVLCFFPLARHTGADQPFYGLQARGLEDTAEPFATIEEMAAHYAAEIRSVQPSGPYRIGGWSFGGLAAFELAQQLRAAGEEVELLVVMDTAPGVEDGGVSGPLEETGDGSRDNTGWLLTIAEYIKGLRGKDLAVSAADLRPLDGEAQLRFFVERLQRAGVVHSGDSLEQLRRLLRVYKTNVQAYRAYVPRPYAGPITLIRAEQAAFPPDLGPDLGWEKLTAHPIDRQQVPGDHITLLAEPHVRTLAGRLRDRLGGSERS